MLTFFLIIAYVLTFISCGYLLIHSMMEVYHKHDVVPNVIVFWSIFVIAILAIRTIPVNLTLL